MAIGFFDSGVGGLTVLAEARARLPHADLLYYADTDNVPYGEKSRDEIRELVLKAVASMTPYHLSALVVACNTATSVAVTDLRAIYPFPIIGMEPAVKPALALAKERRVLVFATALTLREEKFHSLVTRLAADEKIDYVALPGLVTLAEKGIFEDEPVSDYLKEVLSPYPLSAYGAVVLGCTHFPYFRPMISRFFGPEVSVIDGNSGTVNQLMRLMEPNDGVRSGTTIFLESGRAVKDNRFNHLLERIAATRYS